MLVSCVRFTLPTQLLQHTAVRKSHISIDKGTDQLHLCFL